MLWWRRGRKIRHAEGVNCLISCGAALQTPYMYVTGAGVQR